MSGSLDMRGASAWVATLFGIGLLRPAPGTWASLAAMPPGILVMWHAGPWGVLVAALVVLAAGLLATTGVLARLPPGADRDHGSIVIDEACGQLIALIPAMMSPVLWLLAFVLFRLFDIWKPGPVRMLERLGGPCGVMLDDVAAGACAGACVWAAALLGAAGV